MQKENIFTHKILPILAIFILVSFIFINNCFASTEYPSPYTVDHGGLRYIGYVIYKINNTYHMLLVASDSESNVNSTDIQVSNEDLIAVTAYSSVTVYKYTFSRGSDSWSYVSVDNLTANTYKFYDNISNAAFYESFDDIDGVDNKVIFFQKTPVPSILVGTLESTNPVEVWETLMKNVVVSLVVFLVGFLSFRKAWAFLKTQMKGL